MNTAFALIYAISGLVAGAITLRQIERFDRALAIKYGFPLDGIDTAGIIFTVAFAVMGPVGIIGALLSNGKSIVGERYWNEAKNWRPTPEWQADADRKQRLVDSFQ